MTRLKQSSGNPQARFEQALRAAVGDHKLFEAIVNTPFSNKVLTTKLGLGIVVFLLVNKQDNMIDRVALSNTEQAEGTLKMTAKPFREIRIPADYDKNYLVKAVKTQKPQLTDDWQYLFTPELTPAEARFNQAGGGIACSVVYPLTGRDGGAMIFSYYVTADKIGSEHHEFMQAYTKSVSQLLKN